MSKLARSESKEVFAALTFVCIAAVLLLVSGARAQTKDDLSVSVVFGWQGKMPADRWAPITVNVSPGDSPLGGTVIAEYQQDASGAARFSVPFAATPGTTTPVQVMVALPEQCNRVDLTLMDDAGRVRWRQTFESITRNFAQPLPTLLGAEMPVMAVVGRTTLFEAMRDWPALVASSDFAESGNAPQRVRFAADTAWIHVAPARADVTTLPTSWIAYDALAMLVVVPDAPAPPDGRAVEAIHAWVASGGRLIVRVDAPGDGWRAWVPEEMTRGIEVGSPRTMPVPKKARAAIDRVAARIRSIKESPDGVAGTGIAGADAPAPMAGDTTQVRPIRVDRPGWVVHWDGAEANAGLVVEGRFGFGSIVLLGFDPAKCTTVASTIGAGAVWRAAIEPAVTDILDMAADPYGGTPNWPSPATLVESAVNTALERVAQVPGVGVGVFMLIVACIFALAVLVGPFDFIVLRRLQALQRSWLTALMWIGVASVAAFAGPRLARTEITRINRVSVEDCIAEAVAGASESVELATIGGAVAFRSGLTGTYAGESGVARFIEPDPASWWRGISVRYGHRQAVGGSGVVPVVQRAAGGASGSSRGGTLVELPLALWTFRTFADESSPAPSICARVRSGEGGWSVLVSGMPPGARVTEAALRVGKNWCTLDRVERVRLDQPRPGIAMPMREMGGSVGTMEGGVWAAKFQRQFAESETPVLWAEVATFNSRSNFEEAPLDTRPGALTCLPGSARRSRAIEGLVAGGKWAAVYLEVSDWPMDTPMSWKAESHHMRILRVLALLQEE